MDDTTVFVGSARAAGVTQKKDRHAAEQERPDVAAARLAWRMRQPALSPRASGVRGSYSYRAVALLELETWATTAMARPYGRARRCRRVVAAVPHGL